MTTSTSTPTLSTTPSARSHRRLREYRRKHGICQRCTAKAEPGKTMCAEHLEEQRLRSMQQRALKAKRKELAAAVNVGLVHPDDEDPDIYIDPEELEDEGGDPCYVCGRGAGDYALCKRHR